MGIGEHFVRAKTPRSPHRYVTLRLACRGSVFPACLCRSRKRDGGRKAWPTWKNITMGTS